MSKPTSSVLQQALVRSRQTGAGQPTNSRVIVRQRADTRSSVAELEQEMFRNTIERLDRDSRRASVRSGGSSASRSSQNAPPSSSVSAALLRSRENSARISEPSNEVETYDPHQSQYYVVPPSESDETKELSVYLKECKFYEERVWKNREERFSKVEEELSYIDMKLAEMAERNESFEARVSATHDGSQKVAGRLGDVRKAVFQLNNTRQTIPSP